jgi:hypothetical protein
MDLGQALRPRRQPDLRFKKQSSSGVRRDQYRDAGRRVPIRASHPQRKMFGIVANGDGRTGAGLLGPFGLESSDGPSVSSR